MNRHVVEALYNNGLTMKLLSFIRSTGAKVAQTERRGLGTYSICFDLSCTCCTTSCTVSPQQIERGERADTEPRRSEFEYARNFYQLSRLSSFFISYNTATKVIKIYYVIASCLVKNDV